MAKVIEALISEGVPEDEIARLMNEVALYWENQNENQETHA